MSNHFGFFIMLAAAHDLLKPPGPHVEEEMCNPLSTGSLLIADAVPALAGIMVAPFFFTNMNLRIFTAMALNALGFNIAAFSTSYQTVFAGVIGCAFGCGFGEASIMTYTARFRKEIVSGFSSGTGASSIISAAVYLLLSLVMGTKTILLIMNIMPILQAISYFVIIVHPEAEELGQVVIAQPTEVAIPPMEKSFNEKVKSFFRTAQHGMWYAIPIFWTTFSMYFINQGLFELLFTTGASMNQDTQYRLYATLSALGVFISRSSVQIVRIDKLWVIPILQTGVLIVILSHVLDPFLQYTSIVMIMVFLGGIFGGAGYVNTFYKINTKCEEKEKAKITSMALIFNEFSCVVAGFVAMPAHDAICALVMKS